MGRPKRGIAQQGAKRAQEPLLSDHAVVGKDLVENPSWHHYLNINNKAG
jgi:hypothetical protein